VGTDPEPDDGQFVQNAQCAVSQPDAHRIDVARLIHFLETQTGMVRIGTK
jgi:hypothetical protein